MQHPYSRFKLLAFLISGAFLSVSAPHTLAQPVFQLYSFTVDPVVQWHRQQVFPGLHGHDSIVQSFSFNAGLWADRLVVQYNQHGIMDSIAGYFDADPQAKPALLVGSTEHPSNTELYYLRDPFYHPDTLYRFFFHYGGTSGILKRIEVREHASNIPGDYELVGDHRLKYNSEGQLSQIDWIQISLSNGLVGIHQQEKYHYDTAGVLQKVEVLENRDGNFRLSAMRKNTYGQGSNGPVLIEQQLERYFYYHDSTAIRDTFKTRFAIGHAPNGTISQIKQFNFNRSLNGYELREITYYLQSRHFVSLKEASFKPLSLYPNPTQSVLRLQNIKGGTYTITNTAGIVVQQGSLSANDISVAKLPAGIYLLHWQSEENTAYSRQKFIKQ